MRFKVVAANEHRPEQYADVVRGYRAVQLIDDDESMAETAIQLLTGIGDSFENGPANFSRFGRSPGDMAEQISRVFMGVRLRCANCHNHPLDHWTQDDYHGLSAIFAGVKRGRVVTISDRGEVTHPVTKQPAVPPDQGTRSWHLHRTWHERKWPSPTWIR